MQHAARQTSAPRIDRNSNPKSDAIHRALLSGLLSNIGAKSESFEYNGARGTKFHLFPGSTLFARKPPWIMSAELVETTKLYARTAAPIRPEWLERVAPHLLKKTYSDPHWQAPSGHVMAYEKVTLYGLTLVPRRPVHYGPIDPKTSRQLFIHHALVMADWYTDAKFFRHNRELIEQVQTIENKARRRDLLVDTDAQFEFYDKRIPAGVYNGPLFEKWRRQAEAQTPKLLWMSTADLTRYDATDVPWDQFPDELAINNMALPLTYRLEPGNTEDGVTVSLPLAAINQFPDEPFEWLVPGLLKEKIIALIRSLPKIIRTNFVPAPDVADAAFTAIRARGGSLLDALAEFLGKRSGVRVSRFDFQLDTLPDHLLMNFHVVDSAGKVVAGGRDLQMLRAKVGGEARSNFSSDADQHFHRDKITRWDFDDLPEKVQVFRHGMQLAGYPSLIDAGDSVSLRILDTPEAAAIANRAGLRRLFMLQLASEFKSLARRLRIDQTCLRYSAIGDCDSLRNDIVTAAADRAMFVESNAIRTRDQFIARADIAWKRLNVAADEILELASQTLVVYQSLRLKLDQPFTLLMTPVADEIRAQLSLLVPRGFVLNTPAEWLPHLPRFVRALDVRLSKASNAGLSRDVQQSKMVSPMWQLYADRAAQQQSRGIVDPNLQTFRWMIEEFRVSLFAQELKTSIPISVQRLQKQWEGTRSA